MKKNFLIVILIGVIFTGCAVTARVAENQTTPNNEMQAKVDHNNSTPVLNNNQR